MSRFLWLLVPVLVFLVFGCNCDIVCTERLGVLEEKCVHIDPLESEDPYMGQVLRDVLEKEFVRSRVQICDSEGATIFLTGSAFMTQRASSKTDFFGGQKSTSNQAIESVSLIAKDKDGKLLLSASYDNPEQFTAGKLGREFGSALAAKLR